MSSKLNFDLLPGIDISAAAANAANNANNNNNKMINHIISEYSKLVQKEYKTRHVWVGKIIKRS